MRTRVFAGARARDDEQRPFGGEHGLPLSGIEVGEVLLRRGDGHGSMLARPSASAGARRLDLSHGRAEPRRGPVPDTSVPAAGQSCLERDLEFVSKV